MNDNPNPRTSGSQTSLILEYMRDGNAITSLEALALFGSSRLSARIKDIEKRTGLTPSRKKVHVKNRQGKDIWVTQYWLEEGAL